MKYVPQHNVVKCRNLKLMPVQARSWAASEPELSSNKMIKGEITDNKVINFSHHGNYFALSSVPLECKQI